MKKSLSFLAILVLLCAGALPAQVLPSNTLTVAKKNRIVYVDSSGVSGDFKTISSAFTWVSAQTRSIQEQWVVYVRPGKLQSSGNVNYQETSLTVPSFTAVFGIPTQDLASYNGYNGQPVVGLSAGTGTLVTLSTNSSVNGVIFVANATALTGAVKLLATAGTAAWVTNTSCLVFSSFPDTQNLSIISNDTGALYLKNVSVNRIGAATLTTAVVNNTSSGIVVELGRWAPGTGQVTLVKNAASGQIRLRGVRLDPGATNDLDSSSGPIRVFFSDYATETTSGGGTIVYQDLRGTKLWIATQTPASASATCKQGQIAWDSGFVYVCVSTDTWKRAAIATW